LGLNHDFLAHANRCAGLGVAPLSPKTHNPNNEHLLKGPYAQKDCPKGLPKRNAQNSQGMDISANPKVHTSNAEIDRN